MEQDVSQIMIDAIVIINKKIVIKQRKEYVYGQTIVAFYYN